MNIKVPSFLGITVLGVPYSYCCNGMSSNIYTNKLSSILKNLVYSMHWVILVDN